jgi:hypothetical protein
MATPQEAQREIMDSLHDHWYRAAVSGPGVGLSWCSLCWCSLCYLFPATRTAGRVPRGPGASRASVRGARRPGVRCVGRSRLPRTADRVPCGADTGRAGVGCKWTWWTAIRGTNRAGRERTWWNRCQPSWYRPS